ncbi:hypothetical protein BV898_10681 [Hypsibius exemplaris]|uniref:MARVEL domain-containing protein n=1 Tax=Hypsibius exemplaris TaxID=2072580 RepID=A0A1W0WIZ5_HYPEX|nr:hypothetical protein BV898_10681 [Hypsibius exemplaris]
MEICVCKLISVWNLLGGLCAISWGGFQLSGTYSDDPEIGMGIAFVLFGVGVFTAGLLLLICIAYKYKDGLLSGWITLAVLKLLLETAMVIYVAVSYSRIQQALTSFSLEDGQASQILLDDAKRVCIAFILGFSLDIVITVLSLRAVALYRTAAKALPSSLTNAKRSGQTTPLDILDAAALADTIKEKGGLPPPYSL